MAAAQPLSLSLSMGQALEKLNSSSEPVQQHEWIFTDICWTNVMNSLECAAAVDFVLSTVE